MRQGKLDLILELHQKWLWGLSEGVKAVLSFQDLRRADFNHKNLEHVELSHSYLHNARFKGAQMCGSNLQHTKGITLAQDGHYTMMLVHGHVPMIKAGCQWLTIAEADAHWAEGNEDEWTERTAEYGESQRAMLAYLKSRIK
jgi:hypothetical protein